MGDLRYHPGHRFRRDEKLRLLPRMTNRALELKAQKDKPVIEVGDFSLLP
jgi:hypothetical protein